MLISVTLGNRLNDDGSITDIMRKRLDLTKEFNKQYHPDVIICSGGLANPKAGYTEAQVMKRILVEEGLDKDKILEENDSMTTKENAIYSLKLIRSLANTEPITICVISSSEHFVHYSYKVTKYFTDVMQDESMRLMIYTDGLGD